MVYIIARILAYIVLMPLFFVRVRGRKNARVVGGSVIIANHKSNWDPIVLGHSVTAKPISYLGKEELFANGIVSWFLHRLYCIPVARKKGDLVAIKTAIKALKEGKMLGIFPEGTRSRTGELLPFEQGAALMALKADVPVIPVYIKGGYKLFRPVLVTIGVPIDLKEITDGKTDSKAIQKATDYLYRTVKEMSET